MLVKANAKLVHVCFPRRQTAAHLSLDVHTKSNVETYSEFRAHMCGANTMHVARQWWQRCCAVQGSVQNESREPPRRFSRFSPRSRSHGQARGRRARDRTPHRHPGRSPGRSGGPDPSVKPVPDHGPHPNGPPPGGNARATFHGHRHVFRGPPRPQTIGANPTWYRLVGGLRKRTTPAVLQEPQGGARVKPERPGRQATPAPPAFPTCGQLRGSGLRPGNPHERLRQQPAHVPTSGVRLNPTTFWSETGQIWPNLTGQYSATLLHRVYRMTIAPHRALASRPISEARILPQFH